MGYVGSIGHYPNLVKFPIWLDTLIQGDV